MTGDVHAAAGTSRGRRTTVGVATAMVLSILPPFLTGSLMPFMGDIGLDTTRLGIVVATYFGAGALAAVPGGRLAERLGGRNVLLLANFLTVTCMLAIAAFSRNWIHVGVALGLAGVGNGILQPAGNLAIMRGVRLPRQGLAFGVKQAAAPAATLLAGLAVPALAATVGWRWAFVAGVLPLPLIAFVLPIDRVRGAARAKRGQLHDAKRTLVRIALGAACANAAATTIGAFFVDTVITGGGSAQFAAGALVTGSLACIGMRLAVGWRTDRADAPRLRGVAALTAVGALGFLTLAFAGGPVMWTIGAVVGLGAGWGWPGLLHHSVAVANPQAPAVATGVTTLGMGAGPVFGPPMFGYLAAHLSFTWAWTSSAILAGMAVWLLHGASRGTVRVSRD